MNAKTALILIAVFALLLVAFLLTRGGAGSSAETPGNAPDPQERAQAILDPDLLGTTLRRIVFDLGDHEPRLELARIDGRWRVTEPHGFPANPRAVDEVLTRLGNLRGEPAKQPTDQPPAAHAVELEHADGMLRLELGPRLGAGRASVTRLTDGQADRYETNDELHELFEFYDATLFFASKPDAPLMPETERIEIVAGDQRTAFTQASGRWTLGDGVMAERALAKGLPGYAGIEDYFAILSSLEAIEHRVYDPRDGLSRFGLDRPLIEVTLTPTPRDGSPRPGSTLRVGVPADPQDQTRFVSFGQTGDASPAVFVASTPLALALAQSATTFRDPRLITTPLTLIESIRIDRPGQSQQTLSIRPDGSASLVVGDDAGFELDQQASVGMLVGLIDARAVAYINTDDLGSSPLAVIRLSARLGGEPERLTVLTDPDATLGEATLLVRRAGEPVALRVPESALRPLLEAGRLRPSGQGG